MAEELGEKPGTIEVTEAKGGNFEQEIMNSNKYTNTSNQKKTESVSKWQYGFIGSMASVVSLERGAVGREVTGARAAAGK